MEAPRWIDATEVRQAVSADRARRLIRQVLADGFDPADDPSRLSPVVPGGQLLIMPSSTPRAVGVKVLSVAPGNPDRGLERIQALYVLFDPDTLAPSIILDGTAITALRTPAVSAVAIDALAPARRLHRGRLRQRSAGSGSCRGDPRASGSRTGSPSSGGDWNEPAQRPIRCPRSA